jgi:hypothetical protein
MRLFFVSIPISLFFITCTNHEKGNSQTVQPAEQTVAAVLTNHSKDSLPASPDTIDKNRSMKDYTDTYTTIQWLDSTFKDLGRIKQGEKKEFSFRFKNTGKINLVIKEVSATCGCTIPEKPEKPIAPGEVGVIKAKFDGSGEGEVRKSIFVSANTAPLLLHTLVFRAEIIK